MFLWWIRIGLRNLLVSCSLKIWGSIFLCTMTDPIGPPTGPLLMKSIGRLTLINSVTSTISAYYMQCDSFPVSVTKALNRINRDFLWGSSVDHQKLHAVSWSNVTKPKVVGGLGLKPMAEMNKFALAKLNWRAHSEPNGLWARVLKVHITVQY